MLVGMCVGVCEWVCVWVCDTVQLCILCLFLYPPSCISSIYWARFLTHLNPEPF